MSPTLVRKVAPVMVFALGFACKGEADGSPKQTQAARKVPASLVGTWKFEQLGDVKCDANGKCTPTIARRERLVLTADAKFEYSLYAESHFPPCKLVGHAQGKGTATVKQATLELAVAEGFTKKQDSCGESFNVNEKGTTWKYQFTLASDGTMILTNDEGTKIGPFKRG